MTFKAILFDFIGTTVLEKNSSVISICFANAFNENGIPANLDMVKANRGLDKREIVCNILNHLNYPLELKDTILNSYKIQIENNVNDFSEYPGFSEIKEYTKQNSIKIGVGTGLSRDLYDIISGHLNWDNTQFDYIGIAEEVGKGRPHPDMIYDMMKKCGVENTEMLKVGDTISDIMEGKNANVKTAVILSGTQDENELLRCDPDYVLHSLMDLKEIVY